MATPLINCTAFLPFILPHAIGCPEPVAAFNARLAVIEFCERTKCWREISSQEITENKSAIVAPPEATIHRIEEASINGRALTPTQFTAATDDFSEQSQTGAGRYITQTAPNEVAVYPFEAGTLRVSLFLKPRGDSEFGTDAENPLLDRFNIAPAFILSQHAEMIANGALARILKVKDAAYFDPAMAAHFQNEFNKDCDSQFAQQISGQQRAPVRVKPMWM